MSGLSNFRQVLASVDQVLEVYRMSGDLDYLVKAVVKRYAGLRSALSAVDQSRSI